MFRRSSPSLVSPRGKSEASVYLMDLYSTFAEVSEATVPERAEAKSLRPIPEREQTKLREVL